MTDGYDDKTPILLHPARRTELLNQGRDLFNDESFFEAHEAWEELWHLEQGRDRAFVQGLIQAAAHFVHVRKGNWSGARTVAAAAREKLSLPAANRLYRELDVAPILAAIDYNCGILSGVALSGEGPPPVPDAFMIPRLFGR
jgi:predicted metal-dependent hydrolase